MRRLLLSLLVFCCLGLASCESGGHFSILGYTTKPNYDPCIKTVYVPIFENKTFHRGMEFDLTRATRVRNVLRASGLASIKARRSSGTVAVVALRMGA